MGKRERERDGEKMEFGGREGERQLHKKVSLLLLAGCSDNVRLQSKLVFISQLVSSFYASVIITLLVV